MISDFERIVRFGLGYLLTEMSVCPFAIVSAHEANGDSVAEMADQKRRDTELKHRLWELGLGFIGTRGAWIDQSDRWAFEHSLFLPSIAPEKAIELAKEFDKEAVLLGKNGRLYVVSTDGSTSSLELGAADDLLELGTASRIMAAPKAARQSHLDSQEFFFSYHGRPPTGVAKFGCIALRESPPPLAHFSTLFSLSLRST